MLMKSTSSGLVLAICGRVEKVSRRTPELDVAMLKLPGNVHIPHDAVAVSFLVRSLHWTALRGDQVSEAEEASCRRYSCVACDEVHAGRDRRGPFRDHHVCAFSKTKKSRAFFALLKVC